MTVVPILRDPDPKLRTPCAPVADFGADLQHLVADLVDTLQATSGIGLSAPQIGHLQRVLAMTVGSDDASPRVLINPEILERGRWGFVEESCLSVPGVEGSVMRATRLRVRAQDPTGSHCEYALEDMDAVCLQHEVDHLDGILFVDRLTFFSRLKQRLKRAMRRRDVAALDEGPARH